MDLPKRTKQHKAESDSYAILLYKLRDVGIFRNLTDNDYGIDFEIELVKNEQATGKYIKAQVKSSENLSIRKADSVPTISGIKQSTLNYWAELSYKTHVIAYAVDLKTEDIFISAPLFWQAIRLMDGGSSTKTIEFIPKSDKFQEEFPALFTTIYANSPTLMDEIYSHKMALKYLKQFFGLYTDVFHYDYHMPLNEPDIFQTFLEVSRVLLWSSSIRYEGFTEEENKRVFSYRYWQEVEENRGDEEIANFVAQKPLRALFPSLLKKLKDFEQRVFDSKYYWLNRNITHLKLVYDNPIPDVDTHEEIREIDYQGLNTSRRDGGFNFFCSQD